MDFLQELKDNVDGDIHFDPLSRKIYSIDASIYEVEPQGIVIPRSKEALLTTLQIAAKYRVPVTARGAATGITGACLGKGLIIDTSKYLNKILEINIENEYAICEPGVVQDRLNEALAPFGYRLGPDTSTGNRATLGGMLANNSAGARSLLYGCMSDHVLEVSLALAGGTEIVLGPNMGKDPIYHTVYDLIKKHQEAIEQHYSHIPRHVSGYNLDRLLKDETKNLSKLIAGSEGTLGIATAIKMRISKKPLHTGIVLIHIQNMIAGLKHIHKMLSFSPISLEMIDNKIISAARLSSTAKSKLEWLQGDPEAVFIAEFADNSLHKVESLLNTFAQEMQSIGYGIVKYTDPKKIAEVWDVRKAGLGLLLSKRDYSRAIAFIEDLSVAPDKLSDFIKDLTALLKSFGKEAGIYGHIGSGCMHIRPYIDLRNENDLLLMQSIIQKVSDLVLKYEGAMSGEHGDGLVRSWLNEKMFGPEIYSLFVKIKETFDPNYLMNPHKIVGGPAFTDSLRVNPKTPQKTIPTFLDFSSEGGIELAADMCNGNGQCRKMEGVMCPSFQATHDEFDTTRARAQTLRSIIHDGLKGDLSSPELNKVLDLCLECKGCKRECPSQVDIAKMKSESLFHYQEKYGYSLRSRLFSHLTQMNSLAKKMPTIFNWFIGSSLGKYLLSKIGITKERQLPTLSHVRFSEWFHQQQQEHSNKKAAIFNDTYTEYNRPEVGIAAFKVLRLLGYQVILISDICCGRPLISKGFLRQAKANAKRVIDTLEPLALQQIPIIGLEPSCNSALSSDFQGLVGNEPNLFPRWKKIREHFYSFEHFMSEHLKNGNLKFTNQNPSQEIYLHTHCHQKATQEDQYIIEILKSMPNSHVTEIQTGCCGLAGSFGYESEHYDLSMKIGELKLFPTINNLNPKTILITNGISCEHQILHGTKRKTLHIAEWLLKNLSVENNSTNEKMHLS